MERRLQDPRQLVFDRVFDGDDLVAAVVDLGNRPIERGRFTRAGGTGHQQHAVGLQGQPADAAQGVFVETERGQAEPGRLLGQAFFVEDAQDGIFAVDAGHDGDAKVDVALLQVRPESAVLRHPALGNVELGHDFDARDGLLGGVGARQGADGDQDAVDAVLDGQPGRRGFEVDVAGPGLERVVERGTHQPHHRAGVFADRLQREFFALGFAGRMAALILQGAVHGPGARFVVAEHGGDVGRVRKTEVDRRR
jgi:hypothetical protein